MIFCIYIVQRFGHVTLCNDSFRFEAQAAPSRPRFFFRLPNSRTMRARFFTFWIMNDISRFDDDARNARECRRLRGHCSFRLVTSFLYVFINVSLPSPPLPLSFARSCSTSPPPSSLSFSSVTHTKMRSPLARHTSWLLIHVAADYFPAWLWHQIPYSSRMESRETKRARWSSGRFAPDLIQGVFDERRSRR